MINFLFADGIKRLLMKKSRLSSCLFFIFHGITLFHVSLLLREKTTRFKNIDTYINMEMIVVVMIIITYYFQNIYNLSASIYTLC